MKESTLIAEVIPPAGNYVTLLLGIIIKRHIVHQLAPAMVQAVLTEEVSY